MEYHLCDTCAQAAVNADLSSDDLDVPLFTAFIERVGTLVENGRYRYPGYWECEACWQVEIGNANVFTTL